MIEFRYDPQKLDEGKARFIASCLERELREAIRKIRPNLSRQYGVTTEGDPFRIAFNQPELRILIFYHEEWKFTARELERLLKKMKASVGSLLKFSKVEGVLVKIRFYARVGHASTSIP